MGGLFIKHFNHLIYVYSSNPNRTMKSSNYSFKKNQVVSQCKEGRSFLPTPSATSWGGKQINAKCWTLPALLLATSCRSMHSKIQ